MSKTAPASVPDRAGTGSSDRLDSIAAIPREAGRDGRFRYRRNRVYDRRHNNPCDRSHLGGSLDRAGQELVMAAHPLGSGSAGTSGWQPSHPYTNNQVVALIRGAVIALVLLGVLAAIVLL